MIHFFEYRNQTVLILNRSSIAVGVFSCSICVMGSWPLNSVDKLGSSAQI